ncbi:hypothetical protein A9Q84_03740 [Halobacteriovorax marinus]|uniref:Secreted protein n=1 Tax=Halobacteriovorax marinus TaxID=97084 RepID=A0A1Y5FGU6_9BACT|nr:hypothetical protein A9Q84_03740 [Halobacteriovorax marinus]
MKSIVLAALLLTSSAFAQYESTSIDFDMPIDIDGTYNSQPGAKKLTASERMKILRKKLEKRNELMVKRKIETLRYQQEVEMMKKIQSAFNKTMNNLNNIQ